MDDLISRQAVQEMIDRIGDMYPYRQIGNRDSYSQYNEAWTDAINQVDAELSSLPSAQRWIPCSERLPELDEAVLATTAWNDITIAWRTGISKWFVHEGNTNAETADVLAWMPLPEPYKGGQE